MYNQNGIVSKINENTNEDEHYDLEHYMTTDVTLDKEGNTRLDNDGHKELEEASEISHENPPLCSFLSPTALRVLQSTGLDMTDINNIAAKEKEKNQENFYNQAVKIFSNYNDNMKLNSKEIVAAVTSAPDDKSREGLQKIINMVGDLDEKLTPCQMKQLSQRSSMDIKRLIHSVRGSKVLL